MKYSLSLAAMATAAAAKGCGLSSFDNLVTFGDSYTDEGRLGYFFGGNGAPPAGELLPESNGTASGGYVWPRIISQNTGATTLNYAVSGATCSDDIVERYLEGIGRNFPSVKEYQVPAFEADTETELYGDVEADNTVYALWIGTNDLGGDGAMLTNRQVEGATLGDFVDCSFGVFDSVYAAGGRHFVLMNAAPLERSPLYKTPDEGGLGDSQFWGDKSEYDAELMKDKMRQYTTAVNGMWEYGVPFHLQLKARWPGASFTIFDVHSLFSDVLDSPAEYLDEPADAEGYYHHCGVDGGDCVDSDEVMSSFFWFDELHPSQRAGECSPLFTPLSRLWL